ncbi:MAG: carbohydrate-binding domain-containing protein [Capnocytophaga sp.]|nr:carbohydrate-binding domain-containing protein [Capnocytophaga sp.]
MRNTAKTSPSKSSSYNWNKLFVALLAMTMVVSLSACSSDDDETVTDGTETGTNTGTSTNTSTTTGSSSSITITDTNTSGTAEGGSQTAENEDDLIANSTFSSVVKIVYSGTSATVTNPLDGNGVTVTTNGGDVTVNATVAAVEYELSGTTTSGSFKIYSDKKFKLTLNGVSITNNDGPAINIQSGKRVFVVLNSGTTNSLTDSASYSTPSDEDAKGTFFSEGQLIFSGTGALNVAGKYKHGIVSDDYVRVIEGNITVTEAVSDAIHANDAFIADGGTLNLKASSDGIDADKGYIVINGGNFTINVADDGIAASYDTDTTIDPYVTINGGTFNIKTAGGEGIESKSTLTINDGDITINAYDDGINATSAIFINGGNIYIKSSTNDAVDSNGTLTITGGRIVAIGASSPEAAFDNDNNTFKITGGTLIGIGGSSSTPTASASTQRSVLLGGYSANTIVNIQDASGNEALTFLVPSSYTTMLYSSAKLQANTTYTVYTGGSVSGGTSFNGLYTAGTYSGGTKSSTSFTTSSMVTSVGGSTGGGRWGGR